MTNDEARRNDEFRMTNAPPPALRHWSFLRISSFGFQNHGSWSERGASTPLFRCALLILCDPGDRRQTAARFEKRFQFRGRLPAKAGHARDILRRGQPQPVYRAESFEQRGLALFADAGKFIQDALRNLLQAKLRVVGVANRCDSSRTRCNSLRAPESRLNRNGSL